MGKLMDTNVITQIGLIVRDIETTARNYAEVFGVDVPPISWTDPVEQAETEYRGSSTVARARLAFFDMGSMQLELIEPDEHPSTWREFLDQHGEGVHHIAFHIEGMKERVQLLSQNGMPLVQKGEYTGGRYAYLDTYPQLKVMLELLENDN